MRPRRILISMVAITCLGCSAPTAPSSTAADAVPGRLAPSSWAIETTEACGGQAARQLLVPFYEGVLFGRADAAFPASLELSYPSPLSAPFVAWRCGSGTWTVVYAPLDEVPVTLRASDSGRALRMDCASPCTFRSLRAGGDWPSVAEALRDAWNPTKRSTPLSERHDEILFFVHDWVSATESPALRTDWSLDELRQRLANTTPRSLVFVWGWDPGGVDLAGTYFWRKGTEDEVSKAIAANPRVSHFHWLNLRTYKTAIPRLNIRRDLDDRARASALRYDGAMVHVAQYVFEAVPMCLASAGWQASRMRELEKLIRLGFDVIQLDEFPTGGRWDAVACSAENHLHRPNDLRDEWAHILSFLRRLASRAGEAGVLLTSEEPSAVLMPFTVGYIDRIANDEPDMYGPLIDGHPGAEPVPLFSTIFRDRFTAYSDLEPRRPLSPGWLPMRKIDGPR